MKNLSLTLFLVISSPLLSQDFDYFEEFPFCNSGSPDLEFLLGELGSTRTIAVIGRYKKTEQRRRCLNNTDVCTEWANTSNVSGNR